MGFYARINQENIVEQIVYVTPDSDEHAAIYLEQVLGLEGPWINARLASNSLNHAQIGYIYIEDLDMFMIPKPFESWEIKRNPRTLNYYWSPPVEYPNDQKDYEWDEANLNWKEVIPE